MKTTLFRVLWVGLVGFLTSCNLTELDTTVNPNAADRSNYLNNPSLAEVGEYSVGLIGSARFLHTGTNAWLAWGGAGREVFSVVTTDTRTLTDLLGANVLDPDAFYNAYYGAAYNLRRRGIDYAAAVQTSSELTADQKEACVGFGYTWAALGLLNAVNGRYTEGARIAVDDIDNPGPLVSYEEGLAEVARLLDLGAAALEAGGSSFPFTAPPGLAGFDTPGTFRQFNRALLARVRVYQEQWQEAYDLLVTAPTETFIDASGSLAAGPQLDFAEGANNTANPYFQTADPSTGFFAADSTFVLEAEPGDTRVFGETAKVQSRTTTTLAGITFRYESKLYPTNSTPVAIIRNEELLLIAAEACIQTDRLAEAQTYLNIVRAGAGLADYSGPETVEDLTNEMLEQRRYSLWFEGHRWVDLRRYDRLSTTYVPLVNLDGSFYSAFPLPSQEINVGGL